MTKTKVLLVGESWVSAATHYKGFDQFSSVTFHLGAEPLVTALRDSPFELTYMPSHEAAEKFPSTREGLAEYGAIILSDVGANTLLLPPDVWIHSKPRPNRLKLISRLDAVGGRADDDRWIPQLPGYRGPRSLATDGGGGCASCHLSPL